MIESYFLHIIIIIEIYIILALSMQLTMGYLGIINFSHISFFCVGAYASTLFSLNGYDFILSFIFALFFSVLLGLVVSLIINKFKGDYVMIATLGIFYLVYSLVSNWTGLTFGPFGIINIPKPVFLNTVIDSNISYLIFTTIIFLSSFFIIAKIIKSSMGRLVEAVRDNELAVKTLGKNTLIIKTYVICISALFAGVSGVLYAHYIGFITPSSFTILQLIPIIIILILGGLTSMRGVVVATVLVTMIPEILRFINFPVSVLGPMKQLVYALLLILIIYSKSKNIFLK